MPTHRKTVDELMLEITEQRGKAIVDNNRARRPALKNVLPYPLDANDQGHLYAVVFHNGVVKVGRSTNPQLRMRAYEKEALIHTNPIVDSWVTARFPNHSHAEAALIEYMRGRFKSVAGAEWFKFNIKAEPDAMDLCADYMAELVSSYTASYNKLVA